jgi:hypothetical protein
VERRIRNKPVNMASRTHRIFGINAAMLKKATRSLVPKSEQTGFHISHSSSKAYGLGKDFSEE